MGLALPQLNARPNPFVDIELTNGMWSELCDICDAATAYLWQVLFHWVTHALVRRSYQNPLESNAANAMGSAHALKTARRTDLVQAVVCLTSDKCYENGDWVWAQRKPNQLGSDVGVATGR
jgi:CDP-glucose 4,6-dehydratase